MTTLDHLREAVAALEFRAWAFQKCIDIRTGGESDEETIARAIHVVSVLAQVREKVLPRKWGEDRPARWMDVFELLRPILADRKATQEALNVLEEIEREERERRRR